MLFPIEISAEAITATGPRYATRTLQEVVLEFGALAMSRDYLHTVVVPVVKRMTGDERLQWREILLACGQSAISSGIATLDPEVDGVAALPNTDSLAVVDAVTLERWAAALGEPPESEVIACAGSPLEISMVGAVRHTRHVEQRVAWSNEHLLPGFDREHIWSQRLAPVFQASKFASIFDVNFLDMCTETTAGAGAVWLLNRIGSLSAQGGKSLKRLTVVAYLPAFCVGDERASSDLAQKLFLHCGSAVEELEIAACDERLLRRLAHTRIIRCSTDRLHRQLTFSDSMDIFDLPSRRPAVHFTYSRLSSEAALVLKREEAAAVELAKRSGFHTILTA